MDICESLLKWYDEQGRVLPWRGAREPYRIWLSEIMLQQTRSETVSRYYTRFLEKYPRVEDLAAAPEDEVLKLWEGLGYYARARNLHRAAKLVAETGGRFPDSVEGLEALPGVGPYAARAIASIAHQIPVPALDGNQLRVYARLLAVERILKTPFDLEKEALALMSRARPGDFNQALMDLGATICTPRNPRCANCPLNTHCRAYSLGEMERYPLRPAPVPKREERLTIFLIETPQGLCLRKRPGKGLLGGLYEFPCAEGHLSEKEAICFLREAGCLSPREFRPLSPARHVFTHLIWRMEAYHLRADCPPEGCFIVNEESIQPLAFPSAIRKYREMAGEILNHLSD